jgi:hypothetical protein
MPLVAAAALRLLLPYCLAAERRQRAVASAVAPPELPFPCHDSPGPFVPGGISEEQAAERRCCLTLPCAYDVGCWGGQMPPSYSAPRFQAITEVQAHHLERTLLWPATKTLNKTFVHQFPNHGWYRVPVPQATHGYFYEGIKAAWRRLFRAEVVVTIVRLLLVRAWIVTTGVTASCQLRRRS